VLDAFFISLKVRYVVRTTVPNRHIGSVSFVMVMTDREKET